MGAGGEAAGPAGELVRRRGARDARPREDDRGGQREELAREAAHVLVGHRREDEDERRPAAQGARRGRARRRGCGRRRGGAADRPGSARGGPASACGRRRRAPSAGRPGSAGALRLLQQPDRDEQVVALVRARQRPQARVAGRRRAQVEGVAARCVDGRGHASRRAKRAPRRASTTRAPIARARARTARRASSGSGPITVGRPSRSTPAFSPAIAASVRPRYTSWSKSMLTIAEAMGSTTLVASSRPPRPTSRTATSTRLRRKCAKAAAVSHLEEGRVRLEDAAADEPLGRVAHRAHRDREVAVGDRAPVDRDPLVHAHEVGRGVAAGAQARRAQRRVAVGRDRALAVRAGDQQRRVRALGVAHLGDERAHRLEPELHPEPHPPGEVETGDAVGGQWGHGRLSLSGVRSELSVGGGTASVRGSGRRWAGLPRGLPGGSTNGFRRVGTDNGQRTTDNNERTDPLGTRHNPSPSGCGCGKVEESVEYS